MFSSVKVKYEIFVTKCPEEWRDRRGPLLKEEREHKFLSISKADRLRL